MNEEISEKYDKESVLLLFCKWAVRSIMEEDMQSEISELKKLKGTFCTTNSVYQNWYDMNKE